MGGAGRGKWGGGGSDPGMKIDGWEAWAEARDNRDKRERKEPWE